jgi:hypothetical protein
LAADLPADVRQRVRRVKCHQVAPAVIRSVCGLAAGS